jgi:hypothetical protein
MRTHDNSNGKTPSTAEKEKYLPLLQSAEALLLELHLRLCHLP